MPLSKDTLKGFIIHLAKGRDLIGGEERDIISGKAAPYTALFGAE